MAFLGQKIGTTDEHRFRWMKTDKKSPLSVLIYVHLWLKVFLPKFPNSGVSAKTKPAVGTCHPAEGARAVQKLIGKLENHQIYLTADTSGEVYLHLPLDSDACQHLCLYLDPDDMDTTRNLASRTAILRLSPAVDARLVQLVDLAAHIRRSAPGFVQLSLFDARVELEQ